MLLRGTSAVSLGRWRGASQGHGAASEVGGLMWDSLLYAINMFISIAIKEDALAYNRAEYSQAQRIILRD